MNRIRPTFRRLGALLVTASVAAAFSAHHRACAQNQQVVSTIRVERPSTIVRATVPLAPGHAWKTKSSPFIVLAPNGTPCPTQWERVTSWPGTNDVRVAEILAEVPVASGPQTYQVVTTSMADRAVPTLSWARQWMQSPPAIRVDNQLIPVQFEALDERSGRVARTRRFFGPHVVGWITAYARQDLVELVLIAHDGEPHSPTWYFDSLSIDGVGGYASFAPEPLVKTGNNSLTLVPQRSDGKANWIEKRGWRRWHVVLHDGTKAAQAAELARGAGWGVSDRWDDVGAFQPHAVQLPDMPPSRKAEFAAKTVNDWNAIRTALTNGTPFGMDVDPQNGSGRLGFRHPWGFYYGGITGGGYRFQWSGVEVALGGAPEGLLELDARFRMIADRQPVIACDARGQPLVMEDWLDGSGNPLGNWRVSAADGTFDYDGGNAGLGWSTANSTINSSRIPPEQAKLALYAPIDWQHHDRAHQPAVSLAWLNNDPSAKWAIEQYAELWRWRERDRLQPTLNHVTAHPGLGCDYGRDAGHLYTVAAAAYALGDNAWRQRFGSLLSGYASLLERAQMPNGLWQERPDRKEAKFPPFGDGTTAYWAISKGTEEALLSGALAAISGSVPGLQPQIAPVIRKHAVFGLWRYFWRSGGTGSAPSDYVAVRPVTYPSGSPSVGLPVTDPMAAPRSGWDLEEIGAALGYAAWAERQMWGSVSSELNLAVIRFCSGSPTPTVYMDTLSLWHLMIDDVAPLYSAMQP